MLNKNKICTFAIILVICPTLLLLKDKLSSQEDIYILTEENQSVEDLKE